jgi:chromosome segregation ATPase
MASQDVVEKLKDEIEERDKELEKLRAEIDTLRVQMVSFEDFKSSIIKANISFESILSAFYDERLKTISIQEDLEILRTQAREIREDNQNIRVDVVDLITRLEAEESAHGETILELGKAKEENDKLRAEVVELKIGNEKLRTDMEDAMNFMDTLQFTKCRNNKDHMVNITVRCENCEYTAYGIVERKKIEDPVV